MQSAPINKLWEPLFVSFVDTRIFKETCQNLNNVNNADNVNNVNDVNNVDNVDNVSNATRGRVQQHTLRRTMGGLFKKTWLPAPYI